MAIPCRQSMEFVKLHGIPSSTAISGASEKFTRIKANMIVQNFIAHHEISYSSPASQVIEMMRYQTFSDIQLTF